MKKIFALICTVSLLVIAMTSCEHEHLFKSEWDSDAEYHWHECGKKNKCEEQSDRAKHDFVLEDGSDDVYKCSVCGYKKTDDDEATDGDPVGYKVTDATEWDSLVGALSFTNFTIEIKFTEPGFEQVKKIALTDSGLHFYEDATTEYYLVKSDGVWEGYKKSGGKFVSIVGDSDMQSLYDTAKADLSFSVPLAGNFDKFTYNAKEGTYTCQDTLLGMADGDDMYCFNIVLTFSKDGVTSLSTEYNFGTVEELKYSFKCYDIGTTELEIPQYVKDEATDTDS